MLERVSMRDDTPLFATTKDQSASPLEGKVGPKVRAGGNVVA
jgi:hypothetical protein